MAEVAGIAALESSGAGAAHFGRDPPRFEGLGEQVRKQSRHRKRQQHIVLGLGIGGGVVPVPFCSENIFEACASPVVRTRAEILGLLISAVRT
jgi:hypothetical protein